ncbi:DUF262 domain-containing protein [Thiomicrospira microaerophila]|uniref:DUF262 domain-containing protein n=1 Tax=Thiomicrospira microaerophila TaxID=406020 RepID=UPI0005CA437F|nr:DUF262 domain-containing protein [Thiomicrospira microaerophila]
MKANETKIEDFLSSNKTQFVIPVYQRNYDWNTQQCKQLLDDILQVGSRSDMNVHFIGSIVYVHDDVYTSSKIKELTIIDGQQRLTTLTLIYVALYRLAMELDNHQLVDEINETYLINKYVSDSEKLKLKPTDNNERALQYLLRSDEGEEFNEYSKLIDNFQYFRTRINEHNMEFVQRGLAKLMFVEISLDREKDDPQRIFESLNSTGLELSQSDLIRNYILMGLSRNDQQLIYQNYWEIIEALAKDEVDNVSRVSDFIRDFLTLENKKIPNKGKVYQEFKDKFPTSTLDNLKATLSSLKQLAKHYNKLINPKNETDKDIQIQLGYINRLEINVAYPFLMKVYDDYHQKLINKDVFLRVLGVVQSYAWRRFIVGLPTNALNKVFMSLYDKVEPSRYIHSIESALVSKSGSQRFPRDQEVIDAFKFKDVYNIKSKNRVYLLERLENHNNNEYVQIEGNPSITIEHIFPQTPDSKWRANLDSSEFNKIKENYLHTISNLTLSGNNGKLSNKPFLEKRDLENAGYADSRLWLNKYLSSIPRWSLEQVEARFALISNRFLEIWPFPSVQLEDSKNEELNIFEAEEPKGKKLEYAIFLDEKLAITQVAKLYLHVMEKLFERNPSIFFTTELAEKVTLTKTPEHSGIREARPINDSYYVESNLDNNGKFERIKLALTLFDLEDDLYIKYA